MLAQKTESIAAGTGGIEPNQIACVDRGFIDCIERLIGTFLMKRLVHGSAQFATQKARGSAWWMTLDR
eukprot:2596649-Pleurochrysis_carterae.AAC.1